MRSRRVILAAVTVAVSGALVVPALSYPRPGSFQNVSVNAAGKPGNADSGWGAAGNDRPGMGVAMSSNGRFVAFASAASDLVAGDGNHLTDVFVRDRATGRTTIVSNPTAGSDPTKLGAIGLVGCAGAAYPAISDDGRYVAFESCAINILGVGKDTNLADDIFVRDVTTGVTTRVSVSSKGAESGPLQDSLAPSMSADGRYVAFESAATNFTDVCPVDTNQTTCDTSDRLGLGKTQVYLHDLRTGATRLVSATASGQVANGSSFDAAISPDGRYVGFVTYANNLAGNDLNFSAANPFATPSAPDVYLKDVATRSVRLISVGLTGQAASGVTPESGTRFGGGLTGAIAISANGRYVAFGSNASDLVPSGLGGGIFVRDVARNATQRVSVSSAGQSYDGITNSVGCGVGNDTVISRDGRYVGFACAPDPTCTAPDSSYAAVYDRVTGALERISMEGAAPGTPDRCAGPASTGKRVDQKLALSGNGRLVAFGTNDPGVIPGLKPTATPGPYQVVVRDRGVALGGGAVWAGGHGATSALVAYRPALHDIFVRWQLSSMLSVGALGLQTTANGVRYEVQVSHVGPVANFSLYRAVGSDRWERVAALVGTFGVTGKEAVVAVPLAALGLTNGARLGGFAAFESVGGGAVEAPTSALWTGR